jgi:hypothetical protein
MTSENAKTHAVLDLDWHYFADLKFGFFRGLMPIFINTTGSAGPLIVGLSKKPSFSMFLATSPKHCPLTKECSFVDRHVIQFCPTGKQEN